MLANQKIRKTALRALAVAAVIGSASAWAARVTSIDFKAADGESQVEITSDGPLQFDQQENAKDQQFILELRGARLTKNASRKLDTSSFPGKVSLVSPYQVQGSGDTARVVVQLREPAVPQVTQQGNVIKISVPGGDSAISSQAAADPVPQAPAVDAGPGATSTTTQASAPEAAGAEGGAASAGGASSGGNAPAPAAEERVAELPAGDIGKVEASGPLEAFIEAKATKRFVGKRITLQVREADILDVLQLIGEASGFNVIVSEQVTGKITLSLVDVPWDQALDLILTTRQLGAERNNNILRILPLTALTAEKQAELAAKKATEASAPRITRVFPISYARLGDLQSVFSKFAGGGADSYSAVLADERTNSLIIRDTPENIERMRRLIEILDTQTPQVLIEAKVVEASEDFSNSIGGSLGIGNKNTDKRDAILSFNQGNAGDPLSTVTAGTLAGQSKGGGTFFSSPSLDFLSLASTIRLNALLTIAEAETRTRIISAPRTVVLNKESASIVSGTPVLVTTIQTTAAGQVSLQDFKSANLSLNVTPTVTNDGGVLMTVNISRDIPKVAPGSGATGIANRNISTKVLVESGSTLVIGGIYTNESTDGQSGFPLLRKLPLIGWLFGTQEERNNRFELFIFITPRILNEKEAGLGVQT